MRFFTMSGLVCPTVTYLRLEPMSPGTILRLDRTTHKMITDGERHESTLLYPYTASQSPSSRKSSDERKTKTLCTRFYIVYPLQQECECLSVPREFCRSEPVTNWTVVMSPSFLADSRTVFVILTHGPASPGLSLSIITGKA